MKRMIELDVSKQNDLGLFRAAATLTLPSLTVVRHKADRDHLEYELRRAFEELVGEIVTKQIKEDF